LAALPAGRRSPLIEDLEHLLEAIARMQAPRLEKGASMMRRALFALFVCAGACSRESSPAPVVALAPARGENQAVAALDRLDSRAAVPLLPMMAQHQKQNMRDHLVVVQEIAAGLAVADFGAIERAAARIGFSESMGQTCTHMGAGAPGFAEQAIEFHQTADRITVAARARDGGRVLAEFAATLKTCTSCHAVWKQQVVDEPTWQRLTSLSASHGAR
jgi:hypothetical protein